MELSFHKQFYRFSSCFFMLLLLLPLLEEVFHILPQAANKEQRKLASLPVIEKDSLAKFPKKFEAYYKDNFGFRQPLIQLGAEVKYHVFNSSSKPDKVSVGKQDWLFLSGEFYKISEDLTRRNLYSPAVLEEKVKIWEARKQELAAMNIHYYKAFWPDKHYIYPEMLSFGMRCANRDTLYRCDQVLNYLKESHSSFHMIDVRADLLKEKKNTRIYHKNDSHWNSYGAFIGYTRLMNEMAKDMPELKPYALDDFKIDWQQAGYSDLAIAMGIQLVEAEPVFTLKQKAGEGRATSIDAYPPNTQVFVNDSATTKLRALVYRDSFTSALIPFLARHFSEIVFIRDWDGEYTLEMVNKVKPDVVIECYATRYFK